MNTSVPPVPLLGFTLTTFPGAVYWKARVGLCETTVLTESDTTTTIAGPSSGSGEEWREGLPTRTMIFVSSLLSTECTSAPFSTTVLASIPPPSSPTPRISTRVPNCPLSGVTDCMLAGVTYSHPSSSRTLAPVSLTTSTSPTRDVPLCAALTVISESLACSTMAWTPPKHTLFTSAPPPKSWRPRMTTRVPFWPAEGSTDKMWPSRRYWKPLLSRATRPVMS